MADPKYAGLPGIVFDQPDVYETGDLPESEQEFHDAYSDLTESNPAFEVLHLSSSDSFEKFKGKYLNTKDVDFSDSLFKKNHRHGYPSKPIEWSLVGASGEETIVEKYQRLKCEVSQLQEEVKDLKGSIEHGEGIASAVDLVTDVDALRAALSNVNLERSLGTNLLSSVSDPEGSIQRKLVNLIENLKSGESPSVPKKGSRPTESSSSKSESSGGALTYELFYAPEHAKLSEAAQMAAIEKKLDRIEAMIGTDSDQMSVLSSWTNHQSILGSVRALGSRMALLEPSHLDHIEGRLHAVHTRMNSISEKKITSDDTDKRARVDELYEMMKKNDAVYTVVPEIVDRLVTLETLHREGNRFNDSLKQLNAAQLQLSSALDSNSALLKEVQKKFLQNFTVIQDNIKMLDQRIQKLKK